MEHERRTTREDESILSDAAATGTGTGTSRGASQSGIGRKWSGRYFSQSDIEEIARIIAAGQQATRKQIAQRVCAALNWRRPNGELKEMRARVVLLRMHENGIIQLPPPRNNNGNRSRSRSKATGQKKNRKEPSEFRPTVVKRVDQLGPLQIERITREDTERNEQWRRYISDYHYLGWTPVVGAQLRYSISVEEELLALISFGAASWKVGSRDQWIGWDAEQREQRLPWIINNTRYLILPWVKSKNLASAILGTLAKRVIRDWSEAYGIEPVLMETFVDCERFAGTCYRAANWICVGQTKGRGKYDRRHQNATSVKDVWLYPLCPTPSRFLTSPIRLE